MMKYLLIFLILCSQLAFSQSKTGTTGGVFEVKKVRIPLKISERIESYLPKDERSGYGSKSKETEEMVDTYKKVLLAFDNIKIADEECSLLNKKDLLKDFGQRLMNRTV